MTRLSDSTRDAFYLRVSRGLCACQLVEQKLKLYIAESQELAKKDKRPLPRKIETKDFAEAALGQLIVAFSELSENTALVGRVKAFREERNFIAHEAIVYCIDPDGDHDENAAGEIEIRLSAATIEAEALLELLHSELNLVRVHLHFDPIPEISNN